MLGGDWDETKWTPAQLPTKELIDPVTGDAPVFLSRYDGHMASLTAQPYVWRGSLPKLPIHPVV